MLTREILITSECLSDVNCVWSQQCVMQVPCCAVLWCTQLQKMHNDNKNLRIMKTVHVHTLFKTLRKIVESFHIVPQLDILLLPCFYHLLKLLLFIQKIVLYFTDFTLIR